MDDHPVNVAARGLALLTLETLRHPVTMELELTGHTVALRSKWVRQEPLQAGAFRAGLELVDEDRLDLTQLVATALGSGDETPRPGKGLHWPRAPERGTTK